MSGQALLLLSDHASYMTGGEYFVDGLVLYNYQMCMSSDVEAVLLQWSAHLVKYSKARWVNNVQIQRFKSCKVNCISEAVSFRG
jgi:hypothetical protein